MSDNFKLIDLHMHTTTSDGTDEPLKLLGKLRDRKIDLFSVTDHDAIEGGILIPDLLRQGDPAFIRGVEFSCKDEHGKYHILGYGYDPKSPVIRGLVDRGHEMRMAKTKARIRYLKERYGMDFSHEMIRKLLSLNNPGKPHIALMMVELGYAGSIKEAIDKYINGKRFPNIYLNPEEAIRSIRSSGGIPVLAHPSYGSGDELILGEEMDQRLQRLMEFGLQGVEAFYSGFTKKIQEELLAFAEKYDLYVTAGSDYHGKNKQVQLMDHNLEDASQGPRGLRRFLEDVEIIRP